MSTLSDYASALEKADVPATVATLHETVTFHSPFSLWEGRADVSAAFTARSRAFTGLVVADVIAGPTSSVLRWTAAVGDHTVEGCEFIDVESGLVSRIDVFLRPAAVLGTVYDAMAAAWPRRHP